MPHQDQITPLVSRRDVLKKVLAVSGGAVVLSTLPDHWETPVVQVGALPAFAATSTVTPVNSVGVSLNWAAPTSDPTASSTSRNWLTTTYVPVPTSVETLGAGGWPANVDLIRQNNPFGIPNLGEAEVDLAITYCFRANLVDCEYDYYVDNRCLSIPKLGTKMRCFGAIRKTGNTPPPVDGVYTGYIDSAIEAGRDDGEVCITFRFALFPQAYFYFTAGFLNATVQLQNGDALDARTFIGPGLFGSV